jgi:stigma-specific protein Stig1
MEKGLSGRACAALGVVGLVVAAALALPVGCSNSSAAPGCPSGSTMCSGACADLHSDPDNCGSCGNKCPALAVCAIGMCVTGYDGAPPTPEAGADGGTDGGQSDGAPEASNDGPGIQEAAPEASGD